MMYINQILYLNLEANTMYKSKLPLTNDFPLTLNIKILFKIIINQKKFFDFHEKSID